MTTTYINAFQSTVNRDKFNFYLRDKNRADQTIFQADSIHPSYLTHHVQTRKVQWINAIAPNVGDTVIVRVHYLDGSVKTFIKTYKEKRTR